MGSQAENEPTKETPYEQWGVHCDYVRVKGLHYNRNTLHDPSLCNNCSFHWVHMMSGWFVFGSQLLQYSSIFLGPLGGYGWQIMDLTMESKQPQDMSVIGQCLCNFIKSICIMYFNVSALYWITWFCIQYNNAKIETWIKLLTHKRHTMSHPHRW